MYYGNYSIDNIVVIDNSSLLSVPCNNYSNISEPCYQINNLEIDVSDTKIVYGNVCSIKKK